jgi:WD40 repeat protein
MITTSRITTALVPLLLLACRPESNGLTLPFQADRFDNAEWSEPVNLGPVVNSSAGDMNAGLSSNGHELYFVSDRADGLGGNDIWVSHRSCSECPWEAPVNLGPPINTAAVEGAPTLSNNGRLLFFHSDRPGGVGNIDVWVSQRISTGADGDIWSDPVNLGPDVNTSGAEQGVYYVREGGEGTATLYFNRTPTGGSVDIYKVSLSSDGQPLGPAVAVSELNSPSADQKVAVRTDGHELLLSSNRAGSFGGQDIWRFTRQAIHDAWSAAEHLGAPLNTPFVDSQPSLSRDGQTLIFTSSRPGGSGGNDLWMSTRGPGGN